MSYILEALKKSQQERDLGQVPTLETLPSIDDSGSPGINYWGVAAVLLAGLAVIIALYAALRGAPTQGETASVAPAPVSPTASVQAPAATGTARQAPVSALVREEAAPPRVMEEPQSAKPPNVTAQTREPPVPEPPQDQANSASPRPTAPAKPEDKIPEDLREEIEAFKQQVRSGKAGRDEANLPPHKLRLPREVEERLPAFLMTVHIYDKEPAKRFVLINARKLREGDRTRQDILVEEILPNGVVLSYEGHRFFRHR